MRRSPGWTSSPVTRRDRSTTPTPKPTRSKAPSSSIPGISAISPPTREHPAWRHPSTMPPMRVSISAGSSRPTEMQSRKKRGSAPWAAMSSTTMATRSMPMVSSRPAWRATRALVPTPSVDETSTGWRYLAGSKANSPPKPPMSLMTSGRKVERTLLLDALDGRLAGVRCRRRRRRRWPSRGGRSRGRRSGAGARPDGTGGGRATVASPRRDGPKADGRPAPLSSSGAGTRPNDRPWCSACASAAAWGPMPGPAVPGPAASGVRQPRGPTRSASGSSSPRVVGIPGTSTG